MDRLLSMRVFQKVVDEGGFAAAARAMDMSPATVTRLFGDLEGHLGSRLMNRTTRKLALTDAGEAYLLRVRGILNEIDDAEAAVSASTQELQGTVHVLSTPILATYFVAHWIAQWRVRYPKVTLDIAIDPFPHMRVDEFDVTFMGMEEGYDANVVARALVTTDWVVCASPGYLERLGVPLVPQDLVRHEYLKFPWQQGGGARNRSLHLQPVDAAGVLGAVVVVDVPVVLQSVSMEVLFHAAKDGAGMTVLPELLVAESLASGTLVHVLPGWVFSRTTVYAAVPSRKLMPTRTRALLSFVTEIVPQIMRSKGH